MDVTYDYRFSSADHVSGAAQLFRRECFEEIGGYVPVKGGGIDVIAVMTARLKGWRTRTFTERVSHHHRLMGSAQQRRKILSDFALGQKDYRLGFHPVWEVFRLLYQMTRRPYVIGGGYFIYRLFLRHVTSMPKVGRSGAAQISARRSNAAPAKILRYQGAEVTDSR